MKLRVRFDKIGKIRFIGHRDVARVVERAVRKTGLPVAYSQGFSPRMRVSFGLALPTCYESTAEYLELPLPPEALVPNALTPSALAPEALAPGALAPGALAPEALTPEGPVPEALGDSGSNVAGIVSGSGLHLPCDREPARTPGSYCSLAQVLSDALPEGMSVSAAVLTERGGPSLQSVVRTCGWSFEILGLDAAAASSAAAAFLEADHVSATREHKGKMVTEDLRDVVVSLSVTDESPRGAVLSAELSASPRVVRPSELVAVLAADHEMGIARRTHQWTNAQGECVEPATPAYCALKRQEDIANE